MTALSFQECLSKERHCNTADNVMIAISFHRVSIDLLNFGISKLFQFREMGK